MILPNIIFLAVFAYVPMYGIIMAFKDFNIMTSLGDSPWVGLKYFKEFFIDPSLRNTVINTLAANDPNALFLYAGMIKGDSHDKVAGAGKDNAGWATTMINHKAEKPERIIQMFA